VSGVKLDIICVVHNRMNVWPRLCLCHETYFFTFLKHNKMVQRKLPLLSLLCTICALLLPSCNQQESGLNDLTKSDPAVSSRSECEPCANQCCCGVELDDDTAAIIQICGTSGTGTTCATVSGTCNGQINGILESVLLNSSNPKHVFCMAGNSAIRIVNLSLSDNAKIRIGCNTVDFDALEFDIAPQDSIKVDVLSLMTCEMAGC
jgi:hypothetical protein